MTIDVAHNQVAQQRQLIAQAADGGVGLWATFEQAEQTGQRCISYKDVWTLQIIANELAQLLQFTDGGYQHGLRFAQ